MDHGSLGIQSNTLVVMDAYIVTCHEKACTEEKQNLAVFEKVKAPFYDLGEATRYAVKAMEAIKKTRVEFPVQHPVMVVLDKKTKVPKYRVELNPDGRIIATPLV